VTRLDNNPKDVQADHQPSPIEQGRSLPDSSKLVVCICPGVGRREEEMAKKKEKKGWNQAKPYPWDEVLPKKKRLFCYLPPLSTISSYFRRTSKGGEPSSNTCFS
jgi:hypothetical protein